MTSTTLGYVLFGAAGLVLLLAVPLVRELLTLHRRVSKAIRDLDSRSREETHKDYDALVGVLLNEQLAPNAPAAPLANVRVLKAATTDAPYIQESLARALRAFQAIETATRETSFRSNKSANDPKPSDEKPPQSSFDAALAMVHVRSDVDKPLATLAEDDDLATLTKRGHWLPEHVRG